MAIMPRREPLFAHSGIPDCSRPIVTHLDGHPEIPGIHGTGFFVRKGEEVFFVTARHCLLKDDQDDASAIANVLHVPYSLDLVNPSERDYVRFNSICSFLHSSPDIPGRFMDIVALQPIVKRGSWQDKRLRSIAAKLPPTGEWLDQTATAIRSKHPILKNGKVWMVAAGFPQAGTSTEVRFAETSPGIVSATEIRTQRVVIAGLLQEGVYPHTMSVADVTWNQNLNGFSGSPVFARYKDDNGIQYALAGMLITGGNRLAHFIRINQILEAISELTGLLNRPS